MSCAVCGKKAFGCFINPTNPKDKGHYCKKHLESITKCFENFRELEALTHIREL